MRVDSSEGNKQIGVFLMSASDSKSGSPVSDGAGDGDDDDGDNYDAMLVDSNSPTPGASVIGTVLVDPVFKDAQRDEKFLKLASDFYDVWLPPLVQGASGRVSFSKDDFNSSEAGVKYFVIGSLSTCIFLFGSSLIYGIIGSTNFSEIGQFISDQYNLPTLLIIGLIFILVSLSLKISAAPFHMWTPDVYQGAPSIVTAFLSTAPKIAVFAVLIRLLVYPFGEIIIDWGKIIIILSIASMIIGSLGALKQDDLKRLMAYSTINHIGFILMALVPGSEDGITAICIYLIFYLTMNLGVFLFILNMRRDQINVTKIKDLSGLYKTEPVIAGCLAIIFFSMAGIPPLAGFIGKLLVLNIVIDNNLFFLAIIAVVTSVIAAFYYIRLIKSMFFDSPTDELDLLTNPQSKLLMTLLSFFNLTVILYPQFFLNLCASITLSLFALK